MYLAADHDAIISYYFISAISDDLYIGPDTDTDALKLTNTKDLYLTDGDLYLQDGGTTRLQMDVSTGVLHIGTDDAKTGAIYLYGFGASSPAGGNILMFLAADYDTTISYYTVAADQDDLLIGPSTDTDALKLDAAKDLYLTDGDAYFQVGGTTNIQLDATNATIYVGQDDVQRGKFYLYGHATETAEGPELWLYLSADHDTTITAYGIQVESDDLYIGPNTDTDVITIAAGTDIHLKGAGIHAPNMKSGTDQADAGAAAGELYADTDDDNTVKLGV